jgi:hypothetical protein
LVPFLRAMIVRTVRRNPVTGPHPCHTGFWHGKRTDRVSRWRAKASPDTTWPRQASREQEERRAAAEPVETPRCPSSRKAAHEAASPAFSFRCLLRSGPLNDSWRTARRRNPLSSKAKVQVADCSIICCPCRNSRPS